MFERTLEQLLEFVAGRERTLHPDRLVHIIGDNFFSDRVVILKKDEFYTAFIANIYKVILTNVRNYIVHPHPVFQME